MTELKCPFCNLDIRTHRLFVDGCDNTHSPLWQELIRARKQLEIYHGFVTKLYLNGNITDESLIRLQKLLYIQNKGDNNE